MRINKKRKASEQVDDTRPVDVGIVIALKEEFTILHGEIKGSCVPIKDPKTSDYDYLFERQSEAGYPYRCVTTFGGEMGERKAALVTQRLISRWEPMTVVVLGIAAGIDGDVRIGDVVVATQIESYLEDSKAVAGEGKNDYTLTLAGKVYRATEHLIKEIRNFEFVHEDLFLQWGASAAEDLENLLAAAENEQLSKQNIIRATPNLIDGPIASGPTVAAATSFIKAVKEKNRKFLALEMESGGVLATIYEAVDQSKSLVLRGISDFGDERKKALDQTKDGALRAYAMRNTVRFLWALLKAGTLPQQPQIPKRTVFLCCDSVDADAVERIAVHLADKAHFEIWFERWNLIPEENRLAGLKRGLATAFVQVLFIGENTPWHDSQVATLLESRADIRVVPVRLPHASETDLPHWISADHWSVFSTLNDDDALWQLECSIRGIAPDRGRPQPKPGPETDKPITTSAESEPKSKIYLTRNPAQVFIRYRQPDESLAHVFSDALERAGHQVFINTGMRWGANWVREIHEALSQSDILLLLLSPEAALSEMVVEEVAIAKTLWDNKGKPLILPIQIRYPTSEPLPYLLSCHFMNIQLERWDGVNDTNRLIESLMSMIEKRSTWPEQNTCFAEVASGSGPLTPLPYSDPRPMGGAIGTRSRFYIVRAQDERTIRDLAAKRSLVTIKGSRQSGKTSLIMRVHDSFRLRKDCSCAYIDFQSFNVSDFQTLDRIWEVIIAEIAYHLDIEEWAEKGWLKDRPYSQNLDRFLKCVFQHDVTRLLICMDEVDRVFSHGVMAGFFSTLRSLYNRGAHDPKWAQVSWLLGTSSEPSFFIENLSESPFNIGCRVDLTPFTPTQITQFAGRFGLEAEPDLIRRLMAFSGGRPYLVHLLLHHLSKPNVQETQLFDAESGSGGILRDHLHRYLIYFQKDTFLAKAMKAVIKGKGCDDARLADRLEAAGLVYRDAGGKVVPLCELYRNFFSKELD